MLLRTYELTLAITSTRLFQIPTTLWHLARRDALLSVNLTGSVKMWCLSTDHVVTRDQFKIIPMPDIIVNYITSKAISEGYSRGADPDIGPLEADPRNIDTLSPLPTMMALNDDAGVIHLADISSNMSNEGVIEPAVPSTSTSSTLQSQLQATVPAPASSLNNDTFQTTDDRSVAAAALLDLAGAGVDTETALIMSVKAALRDRKDEATTVMKAELTQMKAKKV